MEESTTVKSVSIKYGLINGLVGIIFFTILDFTGMAQSQIGQWSSLVIGAAIIYFAHLEFKKGGDGFMSYGQGLGIGTFLSSIAGLLSSIYVYIYTSFINPEYVTAVKEKAMMDMEKRGMSEAEIDQAMKFSESFMTPTAFFIMGIVMSILFGFLLSLVISAITKKNSPELR